MQYRSRCVSNSILVILVGCVLYSFNSCSIFRKEKVQTIPKEAVVYPPAPDTPRIQFLTCMSNSEFLGKRSKFSTFIQGPEKIMTMNKPYGMAFKHGKLYVCDIGLNGLEIIDFGRNKYSNFQPLGKGMFQTPLNCYVDDNDWLYVADPARHDIVVFDSTGTYKARINDTANEKPTDVTIFEDKIYVTDPENHRLAIYDKKSLQFISYFANDYGVGDDGFLYSAYNVLVTADKVYVTDFGDFKVKIYDKTGKYLSAVGSYGTSVGQFVRPKGIAVDKEMNLFVVDAGFENTQIFNKDGQLLMFIGGPYKAPGDMWLPAKVIIDYDNLQYFTKYVDPTFELKYLIIVSNQFGPDKIDIYGAVSVKK